MLALLRVFPLINQNNEYRYFIFSNFVFELLLMDFNQKIEREND